MKTRIYVDGFNLYYGVLKKMDREYKWHDPIRMVELLLSQWSKYQIDMCKYFTAIQNPSTIDPGNNIRQGFYIEALKVFHKNKIKIIKGYFNTKQRYSVLARPVSLTGTQVNVEVQAGVKVPVSLYEEKKTDVNIAVHMINDAYTTDVECFVLVSNDADLSEPLRIIKAIPNKKVIVIAPQDNNKYSPLEKYAHNTFRYISRYILEKSKLPDSIWKGTIIQNPWI